MKPYKKVELMHYNALQLSIIRVYTHIYYIVSNGMPSFYICDEWAYAFVSFEL
jgi:hypothetical protein